MCYVARCIDGVNLVSLLILYSEINILHYCFQKKKPLRAILLCCETLRLLEQLSKELFGISIDQQLLLPVDFVFICLNTCTRLRVKILNIYIYIYTSHSEVSANTFKLVNHGVAMIASCVDLVSTECHMHNTSLDNYLYNKK